MFLDILGFGKIVSDASKSGDLRKYQKVDAALARIHSISQLKGDNQVPNLEVHIFSDSVILTIPPVPTSITRLFTELAFLMWDLMKLRIWVRGGVSVGNHSLDSNRPWGPAVIDAYRIENEIASFPRIAFGAKALSCVNELGLMEGISRDEDGVYSIDAINYILSLIALKEEPPRPESDIPIIRDQLDIAHRDAVENPSVYKKINRLCSEWDNFFTPLESPLNREYLSLIHI